MRRFSFIAASVCCAFFACAPRYGMRVPDELVARLPYETRIELLEAENELAVAIDKRDEAENDVLRARDGLRRAKARLSAAEDEVDRAEDPKSKEIAHLAVEEAESRVTYLRARQEVNVARLDLMQLQLRCAMARFELARLEAARKAKVEGAEDLSLETFQNQVKDCEAEVAERQKELQKDQEAAAAEAKAVWDTKKAALAKKTFDTRASPFVE
ncbi:MAG: hypothetical protein IRZ16_18315 [Myxococcaceae bacterium]|nr:hypothetical protein [Myxococcaceae bacterium]